MDGLLTFTSKVIDSLAWPSAFLIALWMLKKPLEELIKAITKLKYKDWEIDFGKRIEEVKRDAEEALPQPPATLEMRASDTIQVGTSEETSIASEPAPPYQKEARVRESQERYLQLVALHPTAAILDSWLDLETELRAAAIKHDIPNSKMLITRRIAEEFMKMGLWDEATFHIFTELRTIRNTVGHSRAEVITSAQALEYDLLIRRLIAKLRTS